MKTTLPLAQFLLFALTAIAALFSLIDTPFPRLAPLQNLPTLFVVAVIAMSLLRWPMPTSAVACVCVFLLLHTIGGRYIYSYVPYEDWGRAIGLPSPDAALGLGRNSWDRLVHLSFGLCWVHPISTWLARHKGLSLSLATYIAVEFVLAGSAIYEIFEWLLTIFMAGPDALAYNGQQGDPWDPQKDMALAGLGAVTAAAVLSLRNRFATGKPEIIVTDNGFAILHAEPIDAVSLDDIDEIIAYKIDELTNDLVCCDIVTRSGDRQQVRTIHEENPGFDALMARFEILPGFNAKWREAVILPPFVPNRTTIYKRASRG